MSSNLQSQQTDMAPAAPPVHDRAKMIEQFVKELVVDRDFKLDKSGNIVMIRQLHVSKCTVSLLRQICVRFKVSGYKNQNKERTLGLLKNLVTRESLKNRMYDESASCFSEESSSQEEDKAADVLATCTPPAGNVTSTLLLSPEGQSSAGSTCDHDNTLVENNDSVEEYHDAEQEELPSYSNDEDYAARASSLDISIQKKRKATRNMSTSSNSDHDNTMKKKNTAFEIFEARTSRSDLPTCYFNSKQNCPFLTINGNENLNGGGIM
ncbi:hypothetical protein MHU86_21548 [Fragilaria crotonensis]|nr:hypothetical protein MHU86_21548 [Fragilaria crotonensis]